MKNIDIVTELREGLKKGIVSFTYLKKDGSIRKAVGTRNLTKAEEKTGCEVAPLKGGEKNENAYYDIEKQAWRSFVPANIISID